MSDAPISNPFLREVRRLRNDAQEAVLRGPARELTAEQTGAHYIAAHARFLAFKEMEDFIFERLSQGDDFDDD